MNKEMTLADVLRRAEQLHGREVAAATETAGRTPTATKS